MSFRSSSSGIWSSVGNSVSLNNDTHTVCAYNHMSIFAVLSEVYPEVSPRRYIPTKHVILYHVCGS